jgi:hypothetical protein
MRETRLYLFLPLLVILALMGCTKDELPPLAAPDFLYLVKGTWIENQRIIREYSASGVRYEDTITFSNGSSTVSFTDNRAMYYRDAKLTQDLLASMPSEKTLLLVNDNGNQREERYEILIVDNKMFLSRTILSSNGLEEITTDEQYEYTRQ